MEDKLIEILSELKYPIYRQGSMSDDEAYPDTFFTFWNNGSPDHSHYDNAEYGTDWNYNIYCYSNNPENTYSVLESARKLLKSNGWIPVGKGFDVSSDEATHTGRGLELYYMNFKEEDENA